jgi:hypothetical protein
MSLEPYAKLLKFARVMVVIWAALSLVSFGLAVVDPDRTLPLWRAALRPITPVLMAITAFAIEFDPAKYTSTRRRVLYVLTALMIISSGVQLWLRLSPGARLV